MYNYIAGTIQNSKNFLDEAIKLEKQMEEERNKYEVLLKLAKKNKLETIKENVRYDFYPEIMDKANEYLKDKKKNKDSKSYWLILNKKVSDLLNKEIKIDHITLYGYEGYSYQLEFKYNKKNYALLVPIMERLTLNNYEGYFGQIALQEIKNDGYLIDCLYSTYDESELAEVFEKEVK